ncbi:MAG: hypothetical protein NVSMB19_04310 [Vulcanimicrobiaceae bacterium]
MSRSQTDRHALARAALVSFGLHLLAIPLFTLGGSIHVAGAARDGAAGNETTHVAYVTRDRRPRAAPLSSQIRQRAAHATIAPALQRRTLGSSARGAVARRKAAAALAVTPATVRPKRIPPRVRPRITATPEAVRTPDAALPPPADVAAVTTLPPDAEAPSDVRPAVSAPPDGESPPGGWGQSFAKPLVADDAALATLHAKYGGIRTIAIDVDAAGHATHVAIPDSVTGEARAELARTLLAMRYVPAECNGLRCTGTLQLIL